MKKLLTTITTIVVLIAAIVYIRSEIIKEAVRIRRIERARLLVTQDTLNELARSFYEYQKINPNADPNAELPDTLDGWGNKIEYYGNYTYRSAGADSVMGTSDDMHKNAMDFWSESTTFEQLKIKFTLSVAES